MHDEGLGFGAFVGSLDAGPRVAGGSAPDAEAN
jgi:hypothetical protein